MLEKANRNKQISKVENVLFIESSITDIGLPNETAHCIISNCVVNLVPEQEKQLVFNEMYRLLKSGGRTAISDILVKRDLPEELKNDMALYVGCISGASFVQDYEKYLRNAGFAGKQFSPTIVERATNVTMTV
jgi:arsenite methyltransferase